jgi:hypothetical protein
LGYHRPYWDRIMERCYDIVSVPVFEQMEGEGLVVMGLSRKVYVILYGK